MTNANPTEGNKGAQLAERGYSKYFAWLERIGYDAPVMTPRTSTLETLGGLVEDSTSFIRVAVIELSENFEL